MNVCITYECVHHIWMYESHLSVCITRAPHGVAKNDDCNTALFSDLGVCASHMNVCITYECVNHIWMYESHLNVRITYECVHHKSPTWCSQKKPIIKETYNFKESFGSVCITYECVHHIWMRASFLARKDAHTQNHMSLLQKSPIKQTIFCKRNL